MVGKAIIIIMVLRSSSSSALSLKRLVDWVGRGVVGKIPVIIIDSLSSTTVANLQVLSLKREVGCGGGVEFSWATLIINTGNIQHF